MVMKEMIFNSFLVVSILWEDVMVMKELHF